MSDCLVLSVQHTFYWAQRTFLSWITPKLETKCRKAKCEKTTWAEIKNCSFVLQYAMYQYTWEWLIANYLIVYKVSPTASHIYFHQTLR